MRVRRLIISNFRGIQEGVIDFPRHALLVGGNNAGKSTVCEALDLVLGPERMYRRPIVDEHDFFDGKYAPDSPPSVGAATETLEGILGLLEAPAPAAENCAIRIEAILVDLSDEAQRMFRDNLRRWNDTAGGYVDETENVTPEAGDAEGTSWALPIVFHGRFDRAEDDFEGGTFFSHPQREITEENEHRLGAGLSVFSREHKRICGFVFLRALRTGSRALSLQKGSLLDTIMNMSGASTTDMWTETLRTLRTLDPAIGDIPQLRAIQNEIQTRAKQFVGLAPGAQATGFFASDLTRVHLREVVRLFVASEETEYLLPFQRMGTGSVNILVFALLTFIAELKKTRSVIFAMEEPEIAIPPHTQRRLAKFVLREMGQAIVTSHSPYVMEQFETSDIVILHRESRGRIAGIPLEASRVPDKMFRVQRRQFAEAVLAKAVIVVEGATEATVLHAISTALERFLPAAQYTNIDLAGVSIFVATGDKDVPRYGPVFAGMQKIVFGMVDQQVPPWDARQAADVARFTSFQEWPHDGIEDLLVAEIPDSVQRAFLQECATWPDYPHQPRYDAAMDVAAVNDLTRRVLADRKGDYYAYCGHLIACCTDASELPQSLVAFLLELHEHLAPPAAAATRAAPQGHAPGVAVSDETAEEELGSMIRVEDD